jgi:hypothetical protein
MQEARIYSATTSGIVMTFPPIYDSWGLARELKKTLNYVRHIKHTSSTVVVPGTSVPL